MTISIKRDKDGKVAQVVEERQGGTVIWNVAIDVKTGNVACEARDEDGKPLRVTGRDEIQQRFGKPLTDQIVDE